jgi:hypothetical protein
MLTKSYDWDRISSEFDSRLSHEAITEAIELASDALIEKTEKRRRAAYAALEPVPLARRLCVVG